MEQEQGTDVQRAQANAVRERLCMACVGGPGRHAAAPTRKAATCPCRQRILEPPPTAQRIHCNRFVNRWPLWGNVRVKTPCLITERTKVVKGSFRPAIPCSTAGTKPLLWRSLSPSQEHGPLLYSSSVPHKGNPHLERVDGERRAAARRQPPVARERRLGGCDPPWRFRRSYLRFPQG